MFGLCPRRTLTWGGPVILGLTAISVGVWQLVRGEAERQIRQALLEELRPVSLTNCTLRRFGSTYDGGYLMCENLIDGREAAYPYGVGPNDEWGCDVSTRYRMPVQQYDCFDPTRPVCKTGDLLVNKRIGVLDMAAGTPSASALNAPDDPTMPECQLNFAVR